MSAVDLFDVLTNTRLAAYDDPTLPALCAVRLHVDGGRLHAVATDRYRIHRDHAELTAPASTSPAVGPVLLALPDVTRLVRALRPLTRRRDDLGPVALTVPPRVAGVGRVVSVDLPDWSTLRFQDDTDAGASFPSPDRLEASMSGWHPVEQIHVNPAFLADFSRLVHGGRRLAGALGLRFRTPKPRPDEPGDVYNGPIRITVDGRASFHADLMPIHVPAATSAGGRR
ncbi:MULTISPECIES: hypothetical protein [Protofrankia]|uniref:hypothetical protein n=1 Tax=Protofrankia TaxID=2994361 RepID=UPI00192A9808|nr:MULTISPECIES: hypothetical protein [Protofrankia]